MGGYTGEWKATANAKRRLYILNQGRLFPVDTNVECSNDRICFRSRISGLLVLVEDRAPPRWIRRPAAQAAAGERLMLPLSDVGAGIDPESCKVSLDGQETISEYDPDRKALVVYGPSPLLRSGKRRLRASASDRAGNAAPSLNQMITFR